MHRHCFRECARVSKVKHALVLHFGAESIIHLIASVEVPFGSIHESFVFVSQPPCQALVWFVQEAHMWSNAGCMVEVRVVGWADSDDLNGVGDVTRLMSSKWKKSTAVPCCSYRFTEKFNSWATSNYIQLIPIVYFDGLWCSIQSCKPSSFDMEGSHVPVASWGLKESERHRSQGRSKARQAT